ncbi:hypothetical protein GGI20_005757 [Coemansia sp. BCRC 34301]|nr:hypothetical protein GGI20_005757 [Coemansia sp. BCRC 34301]
MYMILQPTTAIYTPQYRGNGPACVSIIEKCVDMISMQCRMIANMLRRSRDASGSSAATEHRHLAPASDCGDVMVDTLNSAVSTLSTTARQLSSDASPGGDPRSESRKRSRGRHGYAESYDSPISHAGVDTPLSLAISPPPTKRRGRPPRDYGDELGSAFAMYANECYGQTEQSILNRSGANPDARVPKGEVLRVAWENWWLSAQGLKDKYLTLSRHETAVNETNMLELLLEYPLPSGALAAQASHRHAPPTNRSHSRSPDPTAPFDAFLNEQIPLLRSKVPDWSDSEIHRRLAVNWNNMPLADREKYSATAARTPGAAAPTSGAAAPRNYSGGGGSNSSHRLTPRARAQSAPRRAYVLFCRQERPVLVADNPQWDLPTVNKELGRRWKDLPHDQRETYYAMEKKEADSRVSSTNRLSAGGTSFASSSLSPDNGGTANGLTVGSSSTAHASTYQKPGGYFAGVSLTTPTNDTQAVARPSLISAGYPNKGPSKAYVYYSRLVRRSVTDSHPEWDLATINRELGRMWKTLPADERQMWEARASSAASAGDSVSSTPRRRESPAGYSHTLAAPSATVATTPSPLPSTAAVSGDNSNTSMPATPVSGSATPMSRDDAVALLHHRSYDGESEAEDVEMQDDETESEEALESQARATSDISAYPASAQYSATRSPTHDSAAPLPTGSLPKYHIIQSSSASKPPPTAKLAAVVDSSTAAPSLDFAAQEPPSPKPSV